MSTVLMKPSSRFRMKIVMVICLLVLSNAFMLTTESPISNCPHECSGIMKTCKDALSDCVIMHKECIYRCFGSNWRRYRFVHIG